MAWAALLLMGCSGEVITGNGQVKTETRKLASGAGAVALSLDAQVDLRTGPPSLTVEAEQNLLPEILADLNHDQLTLTTRHNVSLRASKPIVIHVQLPAVHSLAVSGSGSLTAKELKAPKVGLSATGSGSIQVDNLQADEVQSSLAGSGGVHPAGQTRLQTINLTGSGGYDAAGLQSKQADITITGSGQADIAVSDALSANLTGSGQVRYRGRPTVTQQVTGSGKLIPATP